MFYGRSKSLKSFSSYKIMFFLLLSFFITSLKANVDHHIRSTITLPIQFDLDVLETYINSALPEELTDINEQNLVCVEPQYFKTRTLPRCRMKGLKISCKQNSMKIRTLPEIKCDVEGWVKRNGEVKVSGEGETLNFSVPVKSRVTVDAKISETAEATAIIHISVKPQVHQDWSVSIDVDPNIEWSEKPTMRLLEVFKVTLQSRVEPKLKKKLKEFVSEVPQYLAELNIKKRVHSVWNDIQEPIKLNDETDMYLFFKPHEVSYSGINIENNILNTTISTEGKTEVLLGDPNSIDCTKSELCKLGSIPNQKGTFNFHLPVSITYQEMLDLSNKNILEGYSIELIKKSLPGEVKISKPNIQKSTSGDLRISAHIHYDNRPSWLKAIDIFNWFDVEGVITFKGTPKIDQDKRCLVLENLIYDSTTNNDLFDLLVDAAKLKPLSNYFASLMKYQFGKKIDDAVSKANNALSTYKKDDLTVSASLHMASIDDLKIKDKKITINTKLSGEVNANIGL